VSIGLDGDSFGFDFNPVPDRIRVTSDNDQNLRLNSNDGTLAATDGRLAFAMPVTGKANIVASAYTNSVGPSPRQMPGTTLYNIDSLRDVLVVQNPPNDGVLNVVGSPGVDVGPQAAFGDVRPSLLVLLGAVACVLVLTCTSIAGLLLVRTTARKKEFAIRAAFGANRPRLFQQLMTESFLLSLLGGGLGLIAAAWSAKALAAAVPRDIARFTPGWSEIGINTDVLAFTFVISLGTSLLIGLLPALQSSRIDLNESLKEGGKSSARVRHQRIRNLLVISEVALALMLVIGAGLLVKSFYRLHQVDLGFNPASLLTMDVSLPESNYTATGLG
jgi:hypothetical protein